VFVVAGVIQTNFSDHFSMILSIPVLKTINTSKCNAINYIDFKKVVTSLKSELWAGVYDTQNVNVSCDRFYSIVSSAINMATTNKTVSFKYKRLKDWMTAGFLCSARKRQKLSLKVKMHPNNKSLMSYCTKYKNNFTIILRRAKTNFYQKKFSAVASNPKKTWKLIKEVTYTVIQNSNDIKL